MDPAKLGQVIYCNLPKTLFKNLRSTITMGILGLLLTSTEAQGQIEPTQLLSVSRTGGQRETSFEIQVEQGTHLVDVDSILFSDPRILGTVITAEPRPFSEAPVRQFGRFTVTIPSEVAPGRYEMRVGGRNGLSNPRAFLVTDLPHEVPQSVGHDLASATTLPLNHFLHADTSAATIDFYKLQLEQPSTLKIDILAQRMDSRMIPTCKVLDSSGHQIESVRGADGVDVTWVSRDPLPAGTYYLAINDFIYRGGSDYHYQLVARTEIDQPTIPYASSQSGQLPNHWTTNSVAFRSDQKANMFAADSNNNSGPNAEQLQLPHQGNYLFSEEKKGRAFEFTAEKGQVIAVDVIAERLGEPSDGRVVIQRIEPQESALPKLHDVTNFDDSQSISDGAMNLFTKDPSGLITAPESANYLVSIRDLDIGHSLKKAKRFSLRIGQPQPSFQLVAYRPYAHTDLQQSQPIGTRLFRGGTEIIRVFAIRQDGWNGEIRIRCEGLPEGVTAPEAVIAANQKFAQIPITASVDAPASSTAIQLIGQSKEGSIEREAIPTVIQWGKGAGRDYIQTRQTDAIWVSVSELDQAQISATFGGETTIEVKKGESVKIPVKLQRNEGGKAACVARARHFPPGIKAADLTIPPENNEGACEIKAEPAAAAGTYSLWLQLETKIKIKPNPQALQRAEAYRARLQTLIETSTEEENLDSLKSAAAEADKLVEAAKKAANEKEITVYLPTTNATLRVIDP